MPAFHAQCSHDYSRRTAVRNFEVIHGSLTLLLEREANRGQNIPDGICWLISGSPSSGRIASLTRQLLFLHLIDYIHSQIQTADDQPNPTVHNYLSGAIGSIVATYAPHPWLYLMKK